MLKTQKIHLFLCVLVFLIGLTIDLISNQFINVRMEVVLKLSGYLIMLISAIGLISILEDIFVEIYSYKKYKYLTKERK